MNNANKKIGTLQDSVSVEALPGILRTSLAYCSETMLCVFRLKKGSEIPLHTHPAAQTGYVVSGKMLFKKDGEEFTAEPGTGYAFSPQEKHGAQALEDSEIVEVFAPMRPEYM